MLHDPAGLSPPACYAYNSLQTDRQFSRIDNRSRGTVPILAVEAIWTMKNGLLPQKWAVPCCRQGGHVFGFRLSREQRLSAEKRTRSRPAREPAARLRPSYSS